MIAKACQYILKDNKVVSVSDGPVNEEDLAAKGFQVVHSDIFETNLDRIDSIKDGSPVWKKRVKIKINKNNNGEILVHASSLSYEGTIDVKIYDKIFPLAMDEALTIDNSVGYKFSISIEEIPGVYFERLGEGS